MRAQRVGGAEGREAWWEVQEDRPGPQLLKDIHLYSE